jgi:hypothetical protein
MATRREAQAAEQADVPAGFTPADLPAVRRELFMDALAVARDDHDPATQWEDFCEAAWKEAGLAFGFLQREGWPESVDLPAWAAGQATSGHLHSDGAE